MNSNRIIGAKGCDVYSPDANNPLVVLSTKCVRGAIGSDISYWQEKVLETTSDQALIDAVVLAFQVRDIRGGRGERQLFYTMFSNLYLKYPSLVIELMKHVPEYGGWMDVLHMMRYMNNVAHRNQICEMIRKQVIEDEKSVQACEKFSLLGKWLPREGNKYDSLAKEFAVYFWEHDERSCRKSINVMGSYRKRLSALNKALQTVETFECSNRWDEIDPVCVPARALINKRSAYLNERNSFNFELMYDPGTDRIAARLKYREPNNTKRMACRETFQEFFRKAAEGETNINGADSMYPHELVRTMMEMHPEDVDGHRVLNAVWDSIIDSLGKCALGSSIAICDFSGSMRRDNDTPYFVSIAMGILTATMNQGAFRNKFMTFDSVPMWQTIPENASLSEAIQAINYGLGQGHTDFQKGMDLVLETLKANKVKPGDEPKNLIVITDMGFDKACNYHRHPTDPYGHNTYRDIIKTEEWQTHIEMIRQGFKAAGEDMWGPIEAGGLGGWTAPRIIIWNVATKYTNEYHSEPSEDGVLLVSGWSPSVFNMLCAEDPIRAMNTTSAIHMLLDDSRYDPVRRTVREWIQSGWRTL